MHHQSRPPAPRMPLLLNRPLSVVPVQVALDDELSADGVA